jgi:outer membrane protein W
MKLPLAIVALAFSGAAFAQNAEFWFNAGESIFESRSLGAADPVLGTPNDFQLSQHGFRFGFRGDLDTGDHLGYELSYAYSNLSFLNLGVSAGNGDVHTVSGDVLWHFIKRDSRVRPFVMGGIGFSNFVPPGGSLNSGGNSNEFQVNYGVGVKIKAFSKWGRDFGFRADLDQFQYIGKPYGNLGLFRQSGNLQQTAATVGFGILF